MMQDSKSAPLVQPLHLRKSRVECVSYGKSRPASDARSSRCTGTKECSGAKGRDKPPALDVEAQGYSPFAPYVDMTPTCRVEAYESCSDEVVSGTRSPSRLTCDVGLVTSMRPMSLVQSFTWRLCHRSAHEHLGELYLVT